MKDIHIRLRPDRLNAPLATVFAGRLSSAVFVIEGDVPDDMDGLTVRIGRTADPESGGARDDYTIAAAAQDGTPRTFRAYASPFVFPDLSETLEYHVLGMDANGNARWLGSGRLIVMENPSDGSGEEPAIIPADTYIRNPATGLYHLLTAVANEYGEISLTLSEEGITR